MPDDDSIRMYSRARGGRRPPQGNGGPKNGDASAISESPLSSLDPGNGGSGGRGINESEASQIYDKFHREMGVSTFALRAMFRQTKFSTLKNLDKHITTAQLARISTYSRGNRKKCEQRLDMENLCGMDEYLLDFAFSVRPIDTLFEFVDLNQNDPDIRVLRNIFAEEDTLEKSKLPADARLKEIVLEYQKILKAEVDLLSGVNQADKTLQIRAIAECARECFDKIRTITIQNKSGPASTVNDTSQATPEASSAKQPEYATEPQRITKESMETYKRGRGAG